ncbi:hypothetical protein D3C81_2102460 [compost metagenome]
MHDGLLLNQPLATVSNFTRHLGIGFGQQHDKLFASIASDKIARAIQRQTQRLGDRYQTFVALNMAVQIVVLLEEIDVQQ